MKYFFLGVEFILGLAFTFAFALPQARATDLCSTILSPPEIAEFSELRAIREPFTSNSKSVRHFRAERKDYLLINLAKLEVWRPEAVLAQHFLNTILPKIYRDDLNMNDSFQSIMWQTNEITHQRMSVLLAVEPSPERTWNVIGGLAFVIARSPMDQLPFEIELDSRRISPDQLSLALRHIQYPRIEIARLGTIGRTLSEKSRRYQALIRVTNELMAQETQIPSFLLYTSTAHLRLYAHWQFTIEKLLDLPGQRDRLNSTREPMPDLIGRVI